MIEGTEIQKLGNPPHKCQGGGGIYKLAGNVLRNQIIVVLQHVM